jgi:hypothetical protein
LVAAAGPGRSNSSNTTGTVDACGSA